MATIDMELFECERYRLMAGWSSDYLLPTDRAKYRLRGCTTKSWKTIQEVEAAMLAPGWAWEQLQDDQGNLMGWTVDLQTPEVDAEGWAYAANFSKDFAHGSAKTSLQKIVRWRRLVRTQTFSGNEALTGGGLVVGRVSMSTSATDADNSSCCGKGTEPLKAVGATDPVPSAPVCPVCPNVDLEGAAYIQRLLPEAIAQASLYISEWSLFACLQLKRQLLERLGGGQVNQKEATLDAVLAAFVNAQRSMGTRMSEAFSRKSHNDDIIAKRLQEVEAWFPKPEVEAFTVLAIRRFRPDLACSVRDGTCDSHTTCGFRSVHCEHPGCQHRCCAKDLAKHDEVCVHKLIACEKCGESVPRGEMKVHLHAACPERDAKCIFSCIGCEVPLKARDLNAHLEECTQAHMMLLMRELLKQQESSKAMENRIADLEAQCSHAKAEKEALQQRCNTMEAKSAALETQVAALEKTSADGLKKVSGPVEELKKSVVANKEEAKKKLEASEKEAKKRHEEMEKCYKAQVYAIRTDIASLKDSTSDIGGIRSGIEALKGGMQGLESKISPKEPADSKVEA